MKRDSIRLLLIAPMLALAATAAQAQSAVERGGYGGFSVGQTLTVFSDDSLPVAGATAVAAAILLMLGSSVAYAQDQGWYVGPAPAMVTRGFLGAKEGQ